MKQPTSRGRSLALIAVGISVIFSLLASDTFPTVANFQSMAFQISEVGLLALAIALTMLGAGIDLSVVATANLAAIVAGSVVSSHAGQGTPTAWLILSIVAAICVGVVVGAANGALVAYGGVHPILATLAVMTLVVGIATSATGGATVFGQEAFEWLGLESVWIVPVPLLVVLIAAAALAFALDVTAFGRRLYLVGSNAIAASFSALPVRRTIFLTYVVSGCLASASGLIVLGRTNAANVDFGGSFVLLSILVAVLAGVNPYGGEGRIADVLLALAAVQILSTGINTVFAQQSGSNFLKEASWGFLLLVVLCVPAARAARSGSRRRSVRQADREATELLEGGATSSTGAHALRLSSISKSFGGVQALVQADLVVGRGTVHALVGENGSGKSTLTKIASGVHRADSGSVEIDGQLILKPTPKLTSAAGLEVIYQDLALFPDLTVAENIYLAGDRASTRHAMQWGRARSLAHDSLRALGVDIDPSARVGDLSIAHQQVVAIARALSADARVVIMDEPTAALTPSEIDQLIGMVRALATSQSISFIFISHKLEEVLTLADDVTVIRDGVIVAAGPSADFDLRDLRALMSGADVADTAAHRDRRERGETAPALEFVGATIAGRVSDVSFALHRGEVLGIGGPLGSGRREIALAAFGMLRLTGGSIRIDGQQAVLRSATEAQERGVALVPEDRRTEGLFMLRSIGDNVNAATLGRRARLAPSRSHESERAQAVVDRLRIKTPDHRNLVSTLSGGNQQRVVLGKWIETTPRVLVLDRPTVGVDVGSKAGIYDVVRELAADGVAILLVTDEIDELVDLCDHVLVMNAGRVVADGRPEEITEAELRRLVAGRETVPC